MNKFSALASSSSASSSYRCLQTSRHELSLYTRTQTHTNTYAYIYISRDDGRGWHTRRYDELSFEKVA